MEIDAGDEGGVAVPDDLARHGRVSSAERKAHLARVCDSAKQRLASAIAVTVGSLRARA
jgi:hypothetical protein